MLAHPQFFFHGQKDFSKVIDIEGRVSEPLECGHYWMLWATFAGIRKQRLIRVGDPFPRSLKGRRSKASPTRPSMSWFIGERFLRKPPYCCLTGVSP